MIFFEKLGRFIVKILGGVIFLCLLFLVYCYFSFYILKKDYVNVFGYTFFEVGSGSMSPTILSDDAVIVKINDNYSVNDIITFVYQDSIVTHRVLNIYNNVIITKGDANNIEDISIYKKDVIGRVVYIWKNVGIWKKVLMSPRVVFSVIVTLIIFSVTFSYDFHLYKRFRMRRLSKKKIREMKKVIREQRKKERERKLKREKKKVSSSKKRSLK